MRAPKLKFKKIINFFKNTPKILGTHAFLTFLGLLFFSLILNSLIFYKYIFLAEKGEPKIFEKPLEFKEKTYQEILKVWQEREKRFKEADFKKYPDPFRPISQRRLSEERTQKLLSIPLVQELLKATNLYQFYKAKGEELLLIEERAQIWEELGLGSAKEYQGTYSQNIRLLEELKKELTPSS